jgi:RNA polymerase sigma factor (sigma-70 family)
MEGAVVSENRPMPKDEAADGDQQYELAIRLLDGDDTVLRDILRLYGPAVHQSLTRRYKFIFCAEDIDDVIAVAIHQLWTACDTYDERKGCLRAWFWRIADNAARDVLKHGWQKARQLECDADVYNIAVAADPPSDDPPGIAGTEEVEPPVFRDLRKIIDGLPEIQRTIILADANAKDDVACASYLANELGIPEGTVRVYRKRAMDKIRLELKKRGYDLRKDQPCQ